MTCIVGYVENGNVYIAGDSAGVAGQNIKIRKDTKVFRKENPSGKPMILGYTTSFRMGQILRFGFPIPEIPEYMDPYEYMCTVFIDSLIETFTDKKYAKVAENVTTGGNFLVGFEGKLFQIYGDFQVEESAEVFDATGCGAHYALGAMHQLQKMKILPRTKLIRALKTASYFSTGVAAPFNCVELYT